MLGICLHTSCSDEEVGGGSASQIGEKGLTLNLSVESPVVVNPMSRAVSDFDVIMNLNILVGDETNITKKYYFEKEGGTPTQKDVTVDFSNNTPQIHFDKGVLAATDKIYVVGNYHGGAAGGDLSGQDLTVAELRNLTQTAANGVPTGTMLWGEIPASGSTDGTHISDSHTGYTINLQLTRMIAMVTVVVDGADLNSDVQIRIDKIGLRNVPTSCTIGNPNRYFTADYDNVAQNFSEEGEFKPVTVNQNTVVGGTRPATGTQENMTTQLGTHNYQSPEATKEAYSLFLFETLHEDGFGAADADATTGKGKKPAHVNANATPAQIEEATKNCPYVYVEGYYAYMPTEEGKKDIYGPVKFKFFLGEDATQSFDVKRNTHYKVTLKLQNFAITEDGKVDAEGNLEVNENDLSWRIDSEVGHASMATGDINVNSAGAYTFLPIDADGDVDWKITGEDPTGAYFTWVYDPRDGQAWHSIADGAVTGTTDKKGIWIYVQPYTAKGAGGFSDTAEFYNTTDSKPETREVTITLTATPKNGGQTITQTIKLVQYKPRAIVITDKEKEILFQGEGNKTGTYLMLIDRVGHSGMPWGFKNHELDGNQPTGFRNTYHLIDKTAHSNNNPHLEEAKKYLPWGQGANGSAMVESVQFHGTEMYPTSGGAGIDNPEDYFAVGGNGELPSVEVDQYGNNYYWTLPSIEEWQVIEKRILDGSLDNSIYPIQSFIQYWTSDAVAKGTGVTVDDTEKNGKVAAFAYQIGRNLHTMTADDERIYPYDLRVDRDRSLPYRLICIVKAE